MSFIDYCTCDAPVIRCDDRGCRCTYCGGMERRPTTHKKPMCNCEWRKQPRPDYKHLAKRDFNNELFCLQCNGYLSVYAADIPKPSEQMDIEECIATMREQEAKRKQQEFETEMDQVKQTVATEMNDSGMVEGIKALVHNLNVLTREAARRRITVDIEELPDETKHGGRRRYNQYGVTIKKVL